MQPRVVDRPPSTGWARGCDNARVHVIGTAGHVDHGKSTLVERLTGIDPDRLEEEKRRGLTIDLGFAWLPLPSGREVGIVDVPGHERFIRNMLAGAGGISVCLFVVAANEGWMPQSAEHLAILDVLGIQGGVIALTKSDLVDADTLDLVRAEIQERVAESALGKAPIVSCSGTTGDGLDELIAEIDRVVRDSPPAERDGAPRLWIDRVFTIPGSGTVVTGTLTGGALKSGESIEIAPGGKRARIRSIQSHKKQVPEIDPGNRVALNLAGLERTGAERGNAVVALGSWRPVRRADVLLRVLDEDIIGSRHELSEKGAHLFYTGSAEMPVRIRFFGRDKIRPGEEAFARLTLRDPLPLRRRDRFVLRDAGRVLTFGGGRVIDPSPPARTRDPSSRAEILEQLDRADDDAAVQILVESEGSIAAADAAFRAGSTGSKGTLRRLGPMLFSEARYEDLARHAVTAVERFHSEKPLERGIPRESLRHELDLDLSVFDDLISSRSEVRAVGDRVALESFDLELTPQQIETRDRLVSRVHNDGFTPPLVSESDADEALLRLLVSSGDLVRIGDFLLSRENAAEARRLVRQAIEDNGPQTVAQIRDLLNTTRRYAVPLCEWLDQTGATVRRGDLRDLGPRP